MPIFTPPRRPILAALVAASLAASAPLSAQDQAFKPGKNQPKAPANDKIKEEAREVFGPGKGKPAPATPGAAPVWSIVLVAYHGETQDADAATALRNVQTEGNLKDAYIEKRGG